MMDFGATHCTPQQPKCPTCPFAGQCVAFQTGKVTNLPVKSKTQEKKDRFFVYLVADFQGNTFVRKRKDKDIWQNLWEFPLLELPALPMDEQELERKILTELDIHRSSFTVRFSKPYRQTLTHRVVTAVFCEITFPGHTEPHVSEKKPFENCLCVSPEELKKNIAVPRIIEWYLRDKAVTLTSF